MLPKVAISAGDPAGVGPELALRALTEPHVLAACHPIVFADLSVLTEVSGHLNRPLPACPTLSLNDWEQRASTLNQPAIVDLRKLAAGTVAPGKVTADTGAAAYSYIVAATHAALKHQVAGIVTAPIHKEAFHAAGVAHPGHTELLAELTNCHRYCMMLTSREISCSLVTCHIGLRDVAEQLNTAKILEVIRLTDEAMRKRHGRPARLAVLAANPHAGEGGLFGNQEEERIIVPAVNMARNDGIEVAGPLAPDTAFVPSRRDATDAYVCMYHDQGLIPLKALAFDTAINVTLGLPILRSSVDHGTALDIAWQGVAKATSLYFAIEWVAQHSAEGRHPAEI